MFNHGTHVPAASYVMNAAGKPLQINASLSVCPKARDVPSTTVVACGNVGH